MDANRREYAEIRAAGERGRPDRRVERPAQHIPAWSFFPGLGRQTCLAATGSVARQIRVYGRPFAVGFVFPRNPFSLNVIHTYSCTHARNLTIRAKNRKTSGRF